MAATARSLSLSRQMSVPRLSLEGVIILARITTQAHLLFPAPNCLRGRRICTLDHRYSLSIYRRRRERPCPRPSYSAALSGARYRRSQLSIAVALRARITSARIISPPHFLPVFSGAPAFVRFISPSWRMRVACRPRPRLRASYYDLLHARTFNRRTLSFYHPRRRRRRRRRRERPCRMTVARSGTRCCHFVSIAIAATKEMHACDRPSLYSIHHPRLPWKRFNFHDFTKYTYSYNPTINIEYNGDEQSFAAVENGRASA